MSGHLKKETLLYRRSSLTFTFIYRTRLEHHSLAWAAWSLGRRDTLLYRQSSLTFTFVNQTRLEHHSLAWAAWSPDWTPLLSLGCLWSLGRRDSLLYRQSLPIFINQTRLEHHSYAWAASDHWAGGTLSCTDSLHQPLPSSARQG